MTQPKLGILMLDTVFPRIVGDVGNPASFDFPVRYQRVAGATPEAIVTGDQRIWLQAFIEAGQALVAQGCKGLATTCGFLTLLREEVSTACGVPVLSSALEQVRGLANNLPKDKTPGILTISSASLSTAHLAAANVPESVPIQGVDGGSFARSILGNQTTLDIEAARAEMVAGATTLIAAHPQVGAIVLECTNMPPYAADIECATGRPVHSILTALSRFHAQF